MTATTNTGDWPNLPDVPVLPDADIYMQWNAILDWWSDPCDAPWHVYASLALPILGAAIMALLDPSVSEIVENYVEPGSYGNCHKNRRLKRGRKGNWVTKRTGGNYHIGLPDLDSLVAGFLPMRDELQGRTIGGGEHLAWAIFNRLEYAGYAAMVIDLLGTGFYAWHSALLDTEWCKESSLQVAKTWDTDWVQGPIPYRQVIPQIGPKSARNGGDAGIDGITITRNNWRVLAFYTITNIGTNTAAGEIRVMTNDDEALQTLAFTLDPGSSEEGNVRRVMSGQGHVYMDITVETGAVRIHSTMLWGQQISAQGI